MLTVGFVFFLLLIALHFSGYVLLLALIRGVRPRTLLAPVGPAPISHHVPITLLVPVYNERPYLRAKLMNLLQQNYPPDLVSLLIVDGGSTDGSPLEIEEVIRAFPFRNIRWFVAQAAGKIPQLNEALRLVPRDHLVVITDADAITDDLDALGKTVSYFKLNDDIGMVGGWTMPPKSRDVLEAEHAYWDKQNRLRYMETLSYSSSIVVAPWYAFHLDTLSSFPEDCVADDVHASFAAHLNGKRIIYAPDIRVIELRQPISIPALFKHKLRKANAYTLELLRIIHKLPYMGKRLKFFYLFKIFQFFYLPWAFFSLGVISLLLLYHSETRLVILGYAALGISILLASLTMKSPSGRRRGGLKIQSAVASVVIFSLTFLVLICNFFLFPFWRQHSRYARIPGPQ